MDDRRYDYYLKNSVLKQLCVLLGGNHKPELTCRIIQQSPSHFKERGDFFLSKSCSG